jgi:hypothetical protein
MYGTRLHSVMSPTCTSPPIEELLPLPQTYQEAAIAHGINIEPNAVAKRPALAVHIAKIIALGADLENHLDFILTTMLGTNAAPALALFEKIGGFARQIDALRSVADVVLKPRDKAIFDVVMGIVKSAQEERNRIAHWNWATGSIEDALLLLKPEASVQYMKLTTEYQRNFKKWMAEQAARRKPGGQPEPEFPPFPASEALVYREADFVAVIAKMQEARTCVGQLRFLVDPEWPWPDQIYNGLAAQPEIKAALAKGTAKPKRLSLPHRPG